MDYIARMSNTEPEGNKLYYMYVRLSKGYIHCSNKLKKFMYQLYSIIKSNIFHRYVPQERLFPIISVFLNLYFGPFLNSEGHGQQKHLHTTCSLLPISFSQIHVIVHIINIFCNEIGQIPKSPPLDTQRQLEMFYPSLLSKQFLNDSICFC